MTPTYSYRRASMGSIRLARIAGNHTATSATPTSMAGITKKTSGSHAFTPNGKPAIKRVRPKAATRPQTTPARPVANPET